MHDHRSWHKCLDPVNQGALAAQPDCVQVPSFALIDAVWTSAIFVVSFPAMARAKSASASRCFPFALASMISTALPSCGWNVTSPSVASVFTDVASFNGSGLDVTWQIAGKRSAFLATFAVPEKKSADLALTVR